MINIKDTFLKLTNRRYPAGHEDEVITLLPEFNFQKDKHGNYFIIVKKSDGSFSDSMFTSHLDTHSTFYETSRYVKHVFENDFIKTDGHSNLGADDKAGMVMMLNMITEKIPGLYYFFLSEEIGCIGSHNLSLDFKELVEDKKLPTINRCISFDRSGYDMIITHQRNVKCCSDSFAKELSNQLNEYGFWYKLDNNGGRTDSSQFIGLIPECTNISVGYFNEHRVTEMQDIEFLELLSLVVLKIDWDNLPIKRKIEFPVYKESTVHKKVGTITNRNIKTNTTVTTTTVSKFDDSEFDNWYNEQKNKGWKSDIDPNKMLVP